MTDKELLSITAGEISGTLLNAISRIFITVLEIGRTIGSAINRAKNKKYC